MTNVCLWELVWNVHMAIVLHEDHEIPRDKIIEFERDQPTVYTNHTISAYLSKSKDTLLKLCVFAKDIGLTFWPTKTRIESFRNM